MWRTGDIFGLYAVLPTSVCREPCICPETLKFFRFDGQHGCFQTRWRMNNSEKLREWLFPAILILFILQAMLLPVMIGLTYAVPAERPEHILTYRTGSLVWDKATSVRPDGSAELSFFETLYKNVNADNAEKVLAPGTEKDSVIRLKNDTNREITYTAVLCSRSTSSDLDIGAALSGDGFSDVSYDTLPENIKKETVIRAVGGKLGAKKLQDFDINWIWDFENKSNLDSQDKSDTYLGDKSASGDPDDMTVGFYIIVNDNNSYITPNLPKTGDTLAIVGYLICLALSGFVLLALIADKRKQRKNEN